MSELVEKPSKETNINTELAKQRTHAAYDRTMMAWVRTALTLIGFGIGIFEFTEKTGGKAIFRSSKLIGLLLIITGVISVLMAIHENKIDHQKLLNNDIKYELKTSLGIKVGYVLVAIGIICIIHIILKIIQLGF